MKKNTAYALLFLTVPTIVVVAAVFVLMSWRVAARVEIEVTADRAVFTLGGTDWTQILNSVGFHSITLEKFARIELSPSKLEVADPSQYVPSEDRYPASAWTPLKASPPVVIMGEDDILQPAVTLESFEQGSTVAGILDRIWAVSGSEVTLETRGPQASILTVRVDGQESSAALSLHRAFQMVVDYGRISGIAELPYQADSLSFRAEVLAHSREVKISSQPRSLVIVLTIPAAKAGEPFSVGAIPITALSFTRQNPTGAHETTLVKGGVITYPDYPKVGKVAFEASDFIGLDRLEKFRIEEIRPDPEYKGVRFRLNGIARHLKTGSREFQADHRLTWFETMRQDPQVMLLVSVVLWVFPTTVGAYRLYKEVKG